MQDMCRLCMAMSQPAPLPKGYTVVSPVIISPTLQSTSRVSRARDTNQRDIVTRWDRLLIFGACNLGALACFVICFFLFPVISLGRPRKLVVL